VLETIGVDVGKRRPSLVTGRAGTTFFLFPACTIRYGAAPIVAAIFYSSTI